MNIEKATYEELQIEFADVLKTTLNIEPDPHPSFLDICGFPHYEEIISNWYAFFFNTEGPHGFKSLFIDSLVEIINASGKLPEITIYVKCQVLREHAVLGKSIDLLLYDETSEDDEQSFRNAIIIENKMYATLYNDLDLYYKNVTAEETKAGIVLSLATHSQIPNTYVNILHKDLLNKVMTNLGKYLFRANDKYILLLKDFVQQIQLFSKTGNMKQYVRFYFEHAEKINELNEVKEKAIDALLGDLKIAFEDIPFRCGRRHLRTQYIRYEHEPNLYLILNIDSLFDKAQYYYELWLTYDNALKWKDDKIKSLIKEKSVPVRGFKFNTNNTGSKYAYVGYQEVSFTKSLKDINEFAQRIASDLKNDWYPFLESIKTIINND